MLPPMDTATDGVLHKALNQTHRVRNRGYPAQSGMARLYHEMLVSAELLLLLPFVATLATASNGRALLSSKGSGSGSYKPDQMSGPGGLARLLLTLLLCHARLQVLRVHQRCRRRPSACRPLMPAAPARCRSARHRGGLSNAVRSLPCPLLPVPHPFL